jgi:acyl-CoA synthetase (AMP-forming)/AMP-acid ligase II
MSAITLVDVLQQWAQDRPRALAYRALSRAGEKCLTFGELHLRSRIFAEGLGTVARPGERIVLMMRQDIEFVIALLGCFIAGAIAVPAALPRGRSGAGRVAAIGMDCGAKCIVTDTDELDGHGMRQAADAIGLSIVRFGEIFGSPRRPGSSAAELDPSSIAVLQYTSGATQAPTGVVLTHRNLIANEEIIRDRLRHDDLTVVAGWLPNFHDMGLIGMLLQPLFIGRPCHFMPAIEFIQHPKRWLELVTQCGATTTGVPYFALEHVLQRCPDFSGVDLRRVEVLFCGSEPIRPDGMKAFLSRLAPFGLAEDAFYPCYGLAEATLLVSGPAARLRPSVARPAVSRRSVVPGDCVGCGSGHPRVDLAVVDPVTRVEVADGTEGEIWVGGPSVSPGYWHRAEQTASSFGQFTADGRGPFLKTGDVGFIGNGELFISGRLKDLIIIRGVKHAPQDIEWTVQRTLPWIGEAGVAAIGAREDDRESLVILAELPRTRLRSNADLDLDALREAVIRDHGIGPRRVLLLRPGALSKTTSGKLQRWKYREMLARGDFVPVRDQHY